MKYMNNQLVLTGVGKSVNGYTQAFLSAESFSKIVGNNPQMAVVAEGVNDGVNVRKFDFNGVELWSEYTPATRKSVLRVKDADAKRLFQVKPTIVTPYA